MKDDRLYSSIEIAEEGNTIVFSAGSGNRRPDLYATGLTFENVRRLTNANPWLDAKLEQRIAELRVYAERALKEQARWLIASWAVQRAAVGGLYGRVLATR